MAEDPRPFWEMVNCIHCGKLNKQYYLYCMHCGKKTRKRFDCSLLAIKTKYYFIEEKLWKTKIFLLNGELC
ncbi:MAG: hypothetical protein ACFE9J_15535 [Candidatus Hermodarchaeota archaeon]